MLNIISLIAIFATGVLAQSQSEMNDIYKNIEIHFLKKQGQADVVAFINQSLLTYGDFCVYGDLREGVTKLAENFKVKITEYIYYWEVEIYPVDSVGGHDFTFKVNKTNGEIYDLVVGEIQPDDE